MPTDPVREAPSALFLFAHQDDEFGVFHAIEESLRQGRRVACAYLTHGADGLAQRRNDESRRVLAALGVRPDDIAFAGDALGIADASLPEHLADAGAWIADWIASFKRVELVCVTAWEGGHHDHDALHAITAGVAQRLGLLSRLRQFSLYNRRRCVGPFFRVLAPLAANGTIERQVIPVARRAAYLGLCLCYPSQLKTWIGLFPFVLIHYVLSGEQALQPVSPTRLQERPHEGVLYYEQRRFYRWEQLQARLREWGAGG